MYGSIRLHFHTQCIVKCKGIHGKRRGKLNNVIVGSRNATSPSICYNKLARQVFVRSMLIFLESSRERSKISIAEKTQPQWFSQRPMRFETLSLHLEPRYCPKITLLSVNELKKQDWGKWVESIWFRFHFYKCAPLCNIHFDLFVVIRIYMVTTGQTILQFRSQSLHNLAESFDLFLRVLMVVSCFQHL